MCIFLIDCNFQFFKKISDRKLILDKHWSLRREVAKKSSSTNGQTMKWGEEGKALIAWPLVEELFVAALLINFNRNVIRHSTVTGSVCQES